MRTISVLLLACGGAAWAAQSPEFVHGEECLFCHRAGIGSSWQRNSHNLTTREIEGGEVLLGRQGTRRLKKTGYNRLAFTDGKSTTDFNRNCAQCHTTAVDPTDFTFAYLGLDCFVCHGAVDLKHSAREATVPLGKRAATTAQASAAICATCHLRGEAADLSPADRHIMRASADGACLNCHSIHAPNATDRHRRVLSSDICNDCHIAGQPRKQVKSYVARHPRCEQ